MLPLPSYCVRDAKVSAHSLRDFAGERLARFKVPSLIHFVPEIPKGPAGKIKRDELVAALSITLPTARSETRRQADSAALEIAVATGNDLGGAPGIERDRH